jgi:hypothetical protein
VTIGELKKKIADLPDDLEVLSFDRFVPGNEVEGIARIINKAKIKRVFEESVFHMVAQRACNRTKGAKKTLVLY